MSDLTIERRLQWRIQSRRTVTVGPGLYEDIRDAATALTAKDKEIEALRGERDHYLSSWKEARTYWNIETTHAELAEARAETAERERDEARKSADKCLREVATQARLRGETERKLDEANAIAVSLRRERDEARAALKPFTAYSVGAISKDESFDYRVHVCCSVEDQPSFKHFDAARAVIEQGDKP
jgi:hypothetical protein